MDLPATTGPPVGWNPIADRFGPTAGAEWQVLLNQFIIGEGFALLVLTVPDAGAAKLCRAELEKFLATRGERLADAEIAEPDDLHILTPYLLALPYKASIGALWVEAVVGVTAPDYDAWYEAWFAALTGLNQQRNPFRRHFDYPVILVGASWMAAIMCDNAPDLWSIRSLAIHIEPERAAALPERRQLEPDPVTPMEAPVRGVRRFDPQSAIRAIDTARGVVGRERNLIVLLGRAAAGFAGQGDWTQGESLWREAADTARRVGDLALEAEAHLELGDLAITVGRTADALGSYRASLAIRERLAAADPGNAGWQRDVAVSNAKLGATYRKCKDPAQARRFLLAGRAIMAGLVARYPDWAEWKRDLAWFDAQLAALGP